jgi:hypothetical protein
MTDPQTQMNWVYEELNDLLSELQDKLGLTGFPPTVTAELDDLLIKLQDKQQELNQNEQMLTEHRTKNNLGPYNTWPAMEASEQEYLLEQESWTHKQNIFGNRPVPQSEGGVPKRGHVSDICES